MKYASGDDLPLTFHPVETRHTHSPYSKAPQPMENDSTIFLIPAILDLL
jgi:hypothetical protein